MCKVVHYVSLLILFLFLTSSQSLAQKTKEDSSTDELDTSYISTFPSAIMGRIYLSKKYTNLVIENLEGKKNRISYEPNTNVNLGVGVTVKSFTFNLAYGFRVFNEDNHEKGETEHLDLQSHIYKRRYVLDLFGQFYRGMFLNNTKNYTNELKEPYYLRADMHIRLLGLSLLMVKNHRRFSYAAPFVQNEQQKRSVGSLLYGLRAISLFSSVDSNYVPSFVVDSLYKINYEVKQIRATQVGPSIGYGYSLILSKRIFLTVSAHLAFMVGPVSYEKKEGGTEKEWQVNPTLGARFGIGYNSAKWYLGLTALQDGTQVKTFDKTSQTTVGAGNVRLNYVRRFEMGPKLKSRLEKLQL